MIVLVLGAFISFIMLAFYLGKEHGSRMVFRMWDDDLASQAKEEESRRTDCTHNVWGVVGYPKGDRCVCLDCGDTEPQRLK